MEIEERSDSSPLHREPRFPPHGPSGAMRGRCRNIHPHGWIRRVAATARIHPLRGIWRRRPKPYLGGANTPPT